MKVLIIGASGHGKTSVASHVAAILRCKHIDASAFAAGYFMFEVFGTLGIEYKSVEACHADRHSHYALWRECIKAFNNDDKGNLVREVLKESDIYTGIRSQKVYDEVKGLFDIILYVYAGARVMGDDSGFEVKYDRDEMVLLHNNGPFNDTKDAIREVLGNEFAATR